MKKFLVSLLTLMLAVCCTFSVACSIGEEEQGEQGGSQTTYEVTESQFTSAFILIDAPFQIVATEGELGGSVYTAEISYVPGKIYEKETEGGEIEEAYYSKEGDTYYKYVKEDGEWLKLEADSYLSVLEFYNPLFFVADELELNLSFSDLTFNKETNCYDYVKDYGMGISLNLTFKFENARIVYFGVRLGNDVEAEILTMSFTYDNVAVTLPQIGGGSQGGESGGNEGNQSAYEVTENQFLEATNSANYSVFMVDGENVIKENGVVNQNQSTIVKYVIVQDGFYTKVPGQEVYFQKSGSEYFGYLQNGSEWQKIPVNQDLYNNNRAMILSNASPATMVNGYGIVYTALTFNDTENCYVYSPQGENGKSATIKIFFEDGKIVKFYMNAVNVIEQEEVTITMVYTYDNVTISYPNVGGGSQGGESGGNEGGESACVHNWEEISLNNGIMTYECSKCQEDKTEDVSTLYQGVISNIADTIFGLADGGSSSVAGKFSASLTGDYEWIDADWAVYGMQIKGVTMFVKMLADMMDNPNFNITSAPVTFTYSYPAHDEEGTAILLYIFDVENDKVTMYWDVDSTVDSSTTEIYLYLDVTYDFDTDTLVAFNLASTQSMGGESKIFGYSYYDGNLRFTNDRNYVNEVNKTKAELNAVIDSVIDLKADFTEEYSSMMDAMNPNQGGGNGGGNEGGDEGGEDPTDPNPNPGETPDPEEPELSQEWKALFDLENLSVRQTSVGLVNGEQQTVALAVQWYIDGDTWYAKKDTCATDGVVTDYVEAWFNGQESYIINSSIIDGVTTQAGGYVTYDDISIYYDVMLLLELDTFMSYENSYSMSQSGSRKTYTLAQIYFGETLAYQNVTIIVENEVIRSISYTLPQGFKTGEGVFPSVITLQFYNYGVTAPMFPMVSENPNPNPGETPDPTPDPDPNPGDEETQEGYVFNVNKVSYGLYVWNLGDTLTSGTVLAPETFVVKLNHDHGLALIQDGKTLEGSWELYGEEIMLCVFDETEVVKTLFVYDSLTNTISYTINGVTIEYNMPENVSYQDIVGEVDMMYANLGRIVIGENEIVVGDTLYDGSILEADRAYMKIFYNNTFKLQTVTGLKIYGIWSINMVDASIVLTYDFDDETYNTTVFMQDNGATLYFELDLEGVTYYLNVDGIDGDEGNNPGGGYVFTVTEEEFNNAIALQNVNLGIYNRILTSGDGFEESSIAYVFIRGDRILACQNVYGTTVWVYYVKVDGDYKVYESNDFITWEDAECDAEFANMLYQQAIIGCTPYGAIDYYELTYADFTYSVEEELYIYTNQDITIKLGFVNGQAIYVNVITTFSDGYETVNQEYNSYVTNEYQDVVFPDYVDGAIVGGSAGSLSNGLPNEGNEGEESIMAMVLCVKTLTIHGNTYNVGDAIDDKWVLNRDWAMFKIYENDTFYMVLNGVVYSGEYQNIDDTTTRLYYTNQYGDEGSMDIVVDEELYEFTMNIDGYIIVFEFSHWEGGEPGYEEGEDKEPAYYMEFFTVYTVTIDGIIYNVGDQLPSGEILNENWATFEYYDNYTFWLQMDGNSYCGDIEYVDYATRELFFINEFGEETSVILSLVDEEAYTFSLSMGEYVIVFEFSYSQELGGGEPPYEDAEWGRTFLVCGVYYAEQNYTLGETLPDGTTLVENWAVLEIYSNYRFYLSVYGSVNVHIEGTWSQDVEGLIRVEYFDNEGDECSNYVTINQDGTYSIEIMGYYVTFQYAYGGGDENQGDGEQKYEWKKIYTVSSVNYEGGIYYENSTLPNGEYIDAKWIVVTVYSNYDVEISFNGYGYVGEWKNIDEYTSQIYYFDSEGNSQTLTVDVNNEDGLYTFTLEGYEITVELEFEEYNEDFDQENNGEENLEDTIPPISTEEDKIISGDMIASGLMQ